MDETPGEIFPANAHGSYFVSFAYFYLHHALDKNSHVEALYFFLIVFIDFQY